MHLLHPRSCVHPRTPVCLRRLLKTGSLLDLHPHTPVSSYSLTTCCNFTDARSACVVARTKRCASAWKMHQLKINWKPTGSTKIVCNILLCRPVFSFQPQKLRGEASTDRRALTTKLRLSTDVSSHWRNLALEYKIFCTNVSRTKTSYAQPTPHSEASAGALSKSQFFECDQLWFL
jgi:hypothetical protein